MSVTETVDAVLKKLAEIGIKKRTIAKDYACFYHAICKEYGEEDLDENLISSFLSRENGKCVLFAPNNRLTRREQTSKRAFNVLLNYQESNTLPVRFSCINTLREEDLEALDMYLRSCSEAGNAQRTLHRIRDSIKRFLSVNALSAVTPSVIQKYLLSFKGKSEYYKKREMDEVKKFLTYCANQEIIENDVGYAFPNIKAVKDSKIPSVFTSGEVKELLLYFSARNSKNRLRDYAMVLLMAVYGFRSIDVANLDLRCLDFDNGALMFSQSKTGSVIRHQILPHVGNALADYILKERHDSSSTLIFLQSDGNGLSSKTVSGVVRYGLLASGIDIGIRKYGSHSLRHSVASGLINDGYSIFTVANVLGNTSAETARLYAKVDLSRLALCALEVPAHE